MIQSQLAELEKLVIRDVDAERDCQSAVANPCFLARSWDTAIATIALRDAGVSRHDPAIRKSLDWILSKEVKQRGDWSLRHPTLEPGGWFFEFNNEFYPDVDDTCMILIAFGKCLPEDSVANGRWNYSTTTHRRIRMPRWSSVGTGQCRAGDCRNGGGGSDGRRDAAWRSLVEGHAKQRRRLGSVRRRQYS